MDELDKTCSSQSYEGQSSNGLENAKKEKTNQQKEEINDGSLDAKTTQSDHSAFEDKLCRTFTITVSPPLDHEEQSSDLTSQKTDCSRDRNASRKNERSLVPDELVPEVSLERTESCLPMLEDMLADVSLRPMLDTSECHRMVQRALLLDDDMRKYEEMSELVKKSYHSTAWREEAAKDKSLVDSLILFCRQRIFFLEAPEEETNASIITFRRGRYSRLSRSFTPHSSQSFSSTHSLADSYQDTTTHSQTFQCSTQVTESRFGVILALISSILKLLRNLCVECTFCQDYIYEHRFVDFLVYYLDILLQAGDNCLSGSSFYETLNVSVVKEIMQLPSTFLKFITNCISGHLNAQKHFLKMASFDGLTRLIILTHNSELLACFFCNLWSCQPPDAMGSFFEKVSGSIEILYYWIAVNLHADQFFKNMIEIWSQTGSCEKKRIIHDATVESNVSSNRNPENVWANIFIMKLINQKTSTGHPLFSILFKEMLTYEFPSAEFKVSSWSVPAFTPQLTRSSVRSDVVEQVDHETDWNQAFYLKHCCEKFMKISKSLIIEKFFFLMETIIQEFQIDQLMVTSCFEAPLITLENVLHYIDEAMRVATWSELPCGISKEAMEQCLKFMVVLTAQIARDPSRRQMFDTQIGLPLVAHALRQLTLNWTAFDTSLLKEKQKQRETHAHPLVSATETPMCLWSIKNCLLLLANLCYKCSLMQNELHKQQGVALVAGYLGYKSEETFVREAAIFALRCSCENHQENQNDLKVYLDNKSFSCPVELQHLL